MPSKLTPQANLVSFWTKYVDRSPSKVNCIFPPGLFADLVSRPQQTSTTHNAVDSYDAAVAECKEKVRRIVRECHRDNQKYTDPEFDLGGDEGTWNCIRQINDQDTEPPPPNVNTAELRDALNTVVAARFNGNNLNEVSSSMQILSNIMEGLNRSVSSPCPGSIKRVNWIFEEPQFTVDGFNTSDIRQGALSNCWVLAAIATICGHPGLLEKICVARDEECGVYGFVFFKDGEWISTVIDDQLYLKQGDFVGKDDASSKASQKYKDYYQTGSSALWLAHCEDQNETWLPLLEKAYAKVHGDFVSLDYGFATDALEDLTGGVSTVIFTEHLLSKARLWKELLNEDDDILFSGGSNIADDKGIKGQHAYSVLEAIEVSDEQGKTVRLVKMRNPWGEFEWSGMWSDGSAEWNPYWMKKLNHKFGDDGIFWIRYDDMLKEFPMLFRTRLFGKDWTVVQAWTTLNVSWVVGYQNAKFRITVAEAGPVVIVLAQPDTRYFVGLEGQYDFDLQFQLRKVGESGADYILRARTAQKQFRSISAEIELEAGEYEVLPKIIATRRTSADDKPILPLEDLVKHYAKTNSDKLQRVGFNRDVAHAKALTEKDLQELELLQQKTIKRIEKGKKPKKKEESEKKEKIKEEKETKKEKKVVLVGNNTASNDEGIGNSSTSGNGINTPSTATDAPAEEDTDKEEESDQGETETPAAPAAVEAAETAKTKEPAGVSESTQTGPEESSEQPKEAEDSDDDVDDSEDVEDPWNPVAVVGLRVYSKHADTKVELLAMATAELAALVTDETAPTVPVEDEESE